MSTNIQYRDQHEPLPEESHELTDNFVMLEKWAKHHSIHFASHTCGVVTTSTVSQMALLELIYNARNTGSPSGCQSQPLGKEVQA